MALLIEFKYSHSPCLLTIQQPFRCDRKFVYFSCGMRKEETKRKARNCFICSDLESGDWGWNEKQISLYYSCYWCEETSTFWLLAMVSVSCLWTHFIDQVEVERDLVVETNRFEGIKLMWWSFNSICFNNQLLSIILLVNYNS